MKNDRIKKVCGRIKSYFRLRNSGFAHQHAMELLWAINNPSKGPKEYSYQERVGK